MTWKTTLGNIVVGGLIGTSVYALLQLLKDQERKR